MTKLMEQLVEAAGRLPPDEQDALATHWFRDVRADPISDELRDELDRRLKAHAERPDDVMSWEQVQRHIRERVSR